MASANISGIARDFFLDFLEHYLFSAPVWSRYELSQKGGFNVRRIRARRPK